MFLPRKKQTFTLKTKDSEKKEIDKNTIKTKALGGWEDEEVQQKTTVKSEVKNPGSSTNVNILQQDCSVQLAKANEFQLFNYDELSEKTTLQYETKLVNDIIQPGGIRIKPNENLLAQFCKAAKTLQIQIIASLLISRLELQIPFAMKAKVLYTIEYISKKVDKYNAYFTHYLDYIKNMPYPSDNKQQYQNILNEISNSIVGINNETKPQNVDNLFEFNDPGYNVPPPKVTPTPIQFISTNEKKQTKQTKPSKTFISPEQLKKMKIQQQQAQNQSVNTQAPLITQSNNVNLIEQTTVTQNKPIQSKQDKKMDIFDIDFSTNLTLQPKKPEQKQIIQTNQPTKNVEPIFNLYNNPSNSNNNNYTNIPINPIGNPPNYSVNNNIPNFNFTQQIPQIPQMNPGNPVQNNPYMNNPAYLQQQYLLYAQYQNSLNNNNNIQANLNLINGNNLYTMNKK